MVAQDQKLQEQIKQDPVGTLERLAEPLESDPWIYRIVVLSLGLAAIGVVAGVIVLKIVDKDHPHPRRSRCDRQRSRGGPRSAASPGRPNLAASSPGTLPAPASLTARSHAAGSLRCG